MDQLRSMVGPPALLEHGLNESLHALAAVDTMRSLASRVEYRKIAPEIHRLLATIVTGTPQNNIEPVPSATIPVVAWNIERGKEFDGIANAFSKDSRLMDRDILLLTELDHGMARSGNRFVAAELADRLGMHY